MRESASLSVIPQSWMPRVSVSRRAGTRVVKNQPMVEAGSTHGSAALNDRVATAAVCR
jgi:hypothetical protein